jgi:two-component system cell cycle sensor histidine kinase/response regulator CckA
MAGLWILFSDQAVDALVKDAATLSRLQSYKGWSFVGFTSLLLYVSLRAQLQRWEEETKGRQKAEADLSRTSSLLQALTEQASDSIFVKDLESRYLFLNKAAGSFIGRSLEEVLGRDDHNLFAPEVARQIMLWDRKIMTAGSSETEEQTLNLNGGTRTYQTVKTAFRDEKGEVAGLIGIARDITDRKEAEQRSRANEERLALALGAARMGVWERDLRTNALYWSPECFAIMGRSDFGGSLADFTRHVHPEDVDRVLANSQAAVKNRTQFATEFRINRADGAVRWLTNFGRPIYDGNGLPLRLIGTLQDITERHELEASFRQVQKMDAVGQLAGGVAHDFNNILTVIQSYITLLEEGLVERKEAVHEISVAVDRAASLSRQLLTFSRKQVMQTRDLDLNEVVTDMTKMLRRTLGDDISLTVETAPELPFIHADRGMMEQILLNLAVNSRDAMPAGGRLTVTTDPVTVNEADALANTEAIPGPVVRLRVSDNGAGIPPAMLPHIFEPFFTTKETHKGSGLGLATVHGIVKQHGGWIVLRSEIGHGTTFDLFFPVSPTAPEKPEPAQPAANLSAGKNQTVLLVDDEAPVRMVIRTILHHLGYQVMEAVSGRDALEVLEKTGKKIDVLLTDMVMPDGINGKELAARLRSAQPDLGVILSSGYSVDLAGQELFEQERFAFLQKPYSAERLAKALRHCLPDRPSAGEGTLDAGSPP